MRTLDFFSTHPVFPLDEATQALAPRGGRAATVGRLKHHLATGRLVLVSRAVYAVVPPGVQAGAFVPDSLLVAAKARPDAVFAYHTALELLGVAHSAWARTVVFTARRRAPLALGTAEILFLEDPLPLRTADLRRLGSRGVERQGSILRVTGPERTLVECLRRPALAGGLEELLESAAAFASLDLELLHEILERYDTSRLWAAAGWFLERHQRGFSVPDAYLSELELRRPFAVQYLERAQRGGRLASRWNLVLPDGFAGRGAADER
jgi:predicted transcriptional regulator of viral defense system